MKLIIDNIKCTLTDDIKIKDINKIIRAKLEKANIEANFRLSDEEVLCLTTGDTNKLFTSAIINKIPLAPTDSRYKPDKQHLNSYRLCKEQWESLYDIFNTTFDNLKCSANVKLFEHDDDDVSFISIRSGVTNGVWPNKPKSFPMKGA